MKKLTSIKFHLIMFLLRIESTCNCFVVDIVKWHSFKIWNLYLIVRMSCLRKVCKIGESNIEIFSSIEDTFRWNCCWIGTLDQLWKMTVYFSDLLNEFLIEDYINSQFEIYLWASIQIIAHISTCKMYGFCRQISNK